MRSPRTTLLLPLLLAACEATMPPPPPVVPAPPPSGKAQLDDDDVQSARLPVQAAIDACVAQYADDGKAEAILKVAPTGEVSDVTVYRLVNFTQKRCLARAARAAKFPAFTGPPMRVVWPMTATKPKPKTAEKK